MNLQLVQNLLSSLSVPSLLDEIHLDEIQRSIFIKRDDLIHPVISGNKWRKLEGHIKQFNSKSAKGIVSMGGVYSNHLHALAYVCSVLKIPCDLLIYGWHDNQWTPTLKDALDWSANLYPISRSDAQNIRDQNFNCIQDKLKTAYWIPEGGGGEAGMIGMKHLVDELPQNFDREDHLIVCPCGTGTTLHGLIKHSRHIRIVSLRNVKQTIYPMLNKDRFSWLPATESKSFGKITASTKQFVLEFKSNYGIELDLIYTAPLMQAFLNSNLATDYRQIYFIHTGGLQGNRIHL